MMTPAAATPATPARPRTFQRFMNRRPSVNDAVLSLEAAAEVTRTGDLWLFRGRSTADHAIRAITNAPVNHVGMAVVLDDLPALMWHAEIGRGLLDVWTGDHHRGAQLHDLLSAVEQWSHRYNQQTWLRQLDSPVTAEMEDYLLRTIARTNGTPFPATATLAGRWLRGRLSRPAPVESTYCAEGVGGPPVGGWPHRSGRRDPWGDPHLAEPATSWRFGPYVASTVASAVAILVQTNRTASVPDHPPEGPAEIDARQQTID